MRIADGLDDAFIGIGRRCGQPDLAVYSKSIAVKVLEAQGLSETDALEYFEFNVEGAWIGEETPIWFYEMTLKEYVDEQDEE